VAEIQKYSSMDISNVYDVKKNLWYYS
jgi:hypothetical protein